MPGSASGLPPLNGLRAFEAAGRHLNFRMAAEELGVTQGAVAQQVRGLEAHLGLRLFERRPRGLVLTEAGRIYHQHVGRAFAQLREATTVLRPQPTRVTISVTPTFASKWLIPRLAELTAAHPSIDLRILATESVLSFRSDGIDLAVRQGRPPFGASLDADLLFPQQIIAVCSPALLFGRANLPLERSELRSLILLHDTHNLWPDYLREVFGERGAQAQRNMRFNQTSLTIDAALAGQGVALASRFLVARELATGALVQPLYGSLTGERAFHLLVPRNPRPSASTDAVRTWLLQQRDRGD